MLGNYDFSTILCLIVIVAVWLAAPICCLWKSLSLNRRTMLMRCLPTSTTRGVFIGLAEVKGKAKVISPMRSYLSAQECVWYQWTIEEEWRREEIRTYQDSKGRTRTRVVVRTGWVNVGGDASTDPFLLEDETGSIRVLPDGAKTEGVKLMQRTCGTTDPLYYGKGPLSPIADSTYRRRFVEYGITPGTPLYIIGTTRTREDGINPEFAAAQTKDPYLISTRNEESITRRSMWGTYTLPLLGVAVLLLPLVWDVPQPTVYTIAGTYVGICLLLWFWQWYSGMVDARNRVSQGISQVEVQYQRRHDLIDRLLEMVDGFCRHEAVLQQRAAELRSQIQDGQLNYLVEAYPALKSSQLFMRLHQELSDTEERLAYAREYLNNIGNFYNTRLQLFPGGLFLRMIGFHEIEYYRA